jgi:hypothetical protein
MILRRIEANAVFAEQPNRPHACTVTKQIEGTGSAKRGNEIDPDHGAADIRFGQGVRWRVTRCLEQAQAARYAPFDEA